MASEVSCNDKRIIVKSKVIAAKDGGDFSHALMWLGTTELSGRARG